MDSTTEKASNWLGLPQMAKVGLVVQYISSCLLHWIKKEQHTATIYVSVRREAFI